MSEWVGVKFLKGSKISYFDPRGQTPKCDAFWVVDTEHGPQMARVVRRTSGPMDPGSAARPILREATARDWEQQKQIHKREQEAYRFCRRRAAERDLAMKLVDVVFALDGRKAIFYFTAENRVDFRELVRDLAQQFKTKIEMRQIGVRDEARRLGGVGSCGRSLCCCTFLKDFISVSIRMAKDQNLSLNPAKVSGLCGRLMCCLAYEHAGMKTASAQEEPESAAPAAAVAGKECSHACGEKCQHLAAPRPSKFGGGSRPHGAPAPQGARSQDPRRPQRSGLGHKPKSARSSQT